MLVASGMGGMDEMGIFYETCLESLYPPGKCGAFCNEHTYECEAQPRWNPTAQSVAFTWLRRLLNPL